MSLSKSKSFSPKQYSITNFLISDYGNMLNNLCYRMKILGYDYISLLKTELDSNILYITKPNGISSKPNSSLYFSKIEIIDKTTNNRVNIKDIAKYNKTNLVFLPEWYIFLISEGYVIPRYENSNLLFVKLKKNVIYKLTDSRFDTYKVNDYLRLETGIRHQLYNWEELSMTFKGVEVPSTIGNYSPWVIY